VGMYETTTSAVNGTPAPTTTTSFPVRFPEIGRFRGLDLRRYAEAASERMIPILVVLTDGVLMARTPGAVVGGASGPLT
jgi:hypothetical protein